MSWRALWMLWLFVLPVSAPVLAAAGLESVSGRLTSCPKTPNCVSSDAADAEHHVAAFKLALPVQQAWRRAKDAVMDIPRTTIVEQTDSYLRAECRSLIFRFVDDLELELRPGEAIIAVRSASRIGTSDLGVNRRRVEQLRLELQTRGVIK